MGGGSSAGAASVPTPPMATGSAPRSAPAKSMGGGGGLASLLRLDADVARLESDRAGLDAELAGDLSVLRVFVGDDGAAAVEAMPHPFLGEVVGSEAPERRLAAIDRDAAASSIDVARAARNPDVMVSVGERFMPEDLGMPAGTDISVGVQLPLWGSQGRAIDAARADAQAADAQAVRVDRDLEVARASARAAWEAARARSAVLDTSAVPRAQQAWEASQALYAADRASADDAVRAWETTLEIEREAVLARRDVELRAAELARLGGE